MLDEVRSDIRVRNAAHVTFSISTMSTMKTPLANVKTPKRATNNVQVMVRATALRRSDSLVSYISLKLSVFLSVLISYWVSAI